MASRRMRWATALVATGFFVAGGLATAAQEATPAPSAHAHPAHIHVGTCDSLDPNPKYMLTDVAQLPGTMETAPERSAAIPVERSTTTVDAKLEDLRTGGYAINIHKSAADIGTYIACGNLTGDLDASGALVVGLRELNNSGYAGVAILTANGDKTNVNVYLAEGLTGAGTAAQATPSGQSAATAGTTVVEIANLAYNPAQITIPVGGTVTWKNDDTVPHTVTARDRTVLQSGTINPGDSFSKTFDTPGTIEYFCEFHANMSGTIVVQ